MIVDEADAPLPARGPAGAAWRSDPTSLPEHLSRAYAARMTLDGTDSEPLSLVVTRLAQAGIAKAQLEGERDRLAQARQRCIVSRVHHEALVAALALMPD